MLSVKEIPSTYAEMSAWTNGYRNTPIANNTTICRNDSSRIYVYLHDYNICRIDSKDNMYLDTCGFMTRTTMQRMNVLLGNRGRIYQSRYVWRYVPGRMSSQLEQRYHDGMIVDAFGNVIV